jgi:hypothetical protein
MGPLVLSFEHGTRFAFFAIWLRFFFFLTFCWRTATIHSSTTHGYLGAISDEMVFVNLLWPLKASDFLRFCVLYPVLIRCMYFIRQSWEPLYMNATCLMDLVRVSAPEHYDVHPLWKHFQQNTTVTCEDLTGIFFSTFCDFGPALFLAFCIHVISRFLPSYAIFLVSFSRFLAS